MRTNDLVIIGNGFDIAHGLKTKYSDFITHYLQEVYNKLVDGIGNNDDLLNIDDIAPFSLPFKELNNPEEFYNLLKGKGIRINYRNTFLKDIVSNNNRWMDIEYQYYQHLLNLYRKLEQLGVDHDRVVLQTLSSLNKALDLLKVELKKYLISTMKKHNPEKLSCIDQHFLSIFDKSNSVKVLNFNYTDTPVQYLKKGFTINYIHGSINEPNDEIIFGYGDEMDIYYPKLERLNQHEFIKNFKSHGYFSNNRYNEVSEFIGAASYRVHIMGHSCGLSDRVLLNRVLDNPKCQEIIIYYHTLEDLKIKSVDLSRHFKPESKHKMRTLLNYDNCKPLVN